MGDVRTDTIFFMLRRDVFLKLNTRKMNMYKCIRPEFHCLQI